MAVSKGELFSNESIDKLIKESKVLVVGAGGIGCELLKNLVLSGFEDIEVIDLDTIDVSNLNRQFLFRKEHVGKSKAQIAKESVLQYNPNAKIVAHHDSVISAKYGVGYIQQFSVVLNALDNQAARNQMNRVCLAAGVPLIESGTAGYLGQVEVIIKGVSRCYECEPKQPAKTFPGCTIRNTPSEYIHCIVWSKHLFNQLFGQVDDEDDDVSPDTGDPEAAVGEGGVQWKDKKDGSGDVERVSTRKWFQSTQYDPEKLFNKLFHDDIKYLLAMKNLWKTRRPPKELLAEEAANMIDGASKEGEKNRDEKIWTIAECYQAFTDAIRSLSLRAKSEGDLSWDKDDKPAMELVAACANIRAHIFSIERKSLFDTKSMAGNIIPAIATANAVIAGMVVLQAVKVLQKAYKECPTVYLRKLPNPRNQLLVGELQLEPPNPNCTVCSPKPQVTVCIDTGATTCREFESQVLKHRLSFAAPDVILEPGSIIISSEEGETEHNLDKSLKELGIVDGSILSVDDFIQTYTLKIIVSHRDKPTGDEPSFLLVGKLEDLKPTEQNNGTPAESKEDDDEVIFESEAPEKKRKLEERSSKSEMDEGSIPVKKRKSVHHTEPDDDVIMV